MSIRFVKGPRNYKYTAIIEKTREQRDNRGDKRVNFGDKRYEQYHDKIGLYSKLDHNDKVRRANYRKRHSAIRKKDGRRAIDVKYSPAWFSYHYLW